MVKKHQLQAWVFTWALLQLILFLNFDITQYDKLVITGVLLIAKHT